MFDAGVVLVFVVCCYYCINARWLYGRYQRFSLSLFHFLSSFLISFKADAFTVLPPLPPTPPPLTLAMKHQLLALCCFGYFIFVVVCCLFIFFRSCLAYFFCCIFIFHYLGTTHFIKATKFCTKSQRESTCSNSFGFFSLHLLLLTCRRMRITAYMQQPCLDTLFVFFAVAAKLLLLWLSWRWRFGCCVIITIVVVFANFTCFCWCCCFLAHTHTDFSPSTNIKGTNALTLTFAHRLGTHQPQQVLLLLLRLPIHTRFILFAAAFMLLGNF